MEACSILELGSRWRVGNGNSIRIWHDRWLDRPHLFRPLMPSPFVGVEYVSDLIDVVSASWNNNLVSNLFLLEEVALILAIPLSYWLPPDKLIWHYDAKSLFSVKSAYKVAFNCRFEASSSQSLSRGESVWNFIWKANIPGKVKMCTWKACYDILLSRSNLISDNQRTWS